MYELALFAGAGGGILGGKLLGWKTICAVEYNRYCRKILLRRQKEGHLFPFPIWNDVKTFWKDNPRTGRVIESLSQVDGLVITAGFPCQPYSAAGKGKGEGDERNLWSDTIRIIREVGPEIVLLENVPRLLCFDYFGKILGDLAEAGYDAEWDVVSAAECGAPHKRNRLWVLAYSKSIERRNIGKNVGNGTQRGSRSKFAAGCFNAGIQFGSSGWWDADPANISDTEKFYAQGCVKGSGEKQLGRSDKRARECTNIWGIESRLGRVVDGLANNVDRLAAIGNGQVPIVAAVAFVRLALRVGLDLTRYAPALFMETKNGERK